MGHMCRVSDADCGATAQELLEENTGLRRTNEHVQVGRALTAWDHARVQGASVCYGYVRQAELRVLCWVGAGSGGGAGG